MRAEKLKAKPLAQFRIATTGDHRRCVEYVNGLQRGHKYMVTVDELHKPHSGAARNFYWGFVVTPLAEHVGESKEQMHEIILCELYGFTIRIFRGKEYRIPNKRTSKMSDKEYTEHIHRAQALAGEEGVDTGSLWGSNWNA